MRCGELIDMYGNSIRSMARFDGRSLEKIVKMAFINVFPNHISIALQQLPNYGDGCSDNSYQSIGQTEGVHSRDSSCPRGKQRTASSCKRVGERSEVVKSEVAMFQRPGSPYGERLYKGEV